MLLKLHSDGGRFGMNRCYLSLILMQEILGPFHLVGRSVGNQEKFVVLHRGLVLQDAVLRNPDAVQSRAEGAIASITPAVIVGAGFTTT